MDAVDDHLKRGLGLVWLFGVERKPSMVFVGGTPCKEVNVGKCLTMIVEDLDAVCEVGLQS